MATGAARPTDGPSSTTRLLWEAAEALHGQVYFAAEPEQALAATGLRGFWMGYFASRFAAMGPVGPEVVEAAAYNFHPDLVRRALPDAWSFASPEVVLEARQRGATESLTRLLGPDASSESVVTTGDALLATMATAERAGRALFAAHAGLAAPQDPVGRLWFAATLVREHRGDGHVAALLVDGVGGCESHVLAVARGVADAEVQRRARRWSLEDWQAATASLTDRGLIDAGGRLTPSGHALVDHVEGVTDRCSSVALGALRERTEAVVRDAQALARRVLEAGGLPFPNAIAYGRPAWLDR